MEPAESAFLSGEEAGPHDIQGIGAGFRPAVLDLEVIDRIERVSEREALAAARRCAAEEGLPIGISSGAVLHAALRAARDPRLEGGLVVGIAASFAERYLSTALSRGCSGGRQRPSAPILKFLELQDHRGTLENKGLVASLSQKFASKLPGQDTRLA